VAKFVALSSIALLAAIAGISCSQGPPGRSPPILVDGPREPQPTAGGAAGASYATSLGPDADAGSGGPGAPVPPCTALALCCNAFDEEDPAKAWCEESLTEAQRQEDCEGFVAYYGC
jgi:hypothetical protein